MFMVISVLVGCLISLMILANGQLQFAVGSTWSLLIIHMVGLIASLTIAPLSGNRKDNNGKKPKPYFFIAGSLGLVIIYINNQIFLNGGVVLTLSGMLAGQSIAALVFDAAASIRNKTPFPRKNIAALILVVGGTVGIGISAGVTIPWILFSWVPGATLMIQLLMNSSIAGYHGQTRMLQISYAVGLGSVLILALLNGDITNISTETLTSVSIPLFLGGGLLGVSCMISQNMLLRKISALRLVLGTYLGQFLMGIVLDTVRGRSIDLVYGIGIALVVGGLILQNLRIQGKKGAISSDSDNGTK